MEVKEPYLPPLSPFPSLRSIYSSSDSSEQLIEHRWWMGVDRWQIAGRLIDTAISLCPPSLRSPPAFLVTAQKSIKVQISLSRSRGWSFKFKNTLQEMAHSCLQSCFAHLSSSICIFNKIFYHSWSKCTYCSATLFSCLTRTLHICCPW